MNIIIHVPFHFVLTLFKQRSKIWSNGQQTWKFGKFRETIHHYRVCTPCRNDETNFRFPQHILAEVIGKPW